MKATLALAVVALGSLASCKMAWERKENRPVWNAFEAHMVPDGDAAFWAAMPLLAPLGLAAVALDVAVAHPLQTLDDCFADTKSALWSGLDWQDAYVTECGLLPLRAAASPAFYALAFCSRSRFDVTSKAPKPQNPFANILKFLNINASEYLRRRYRIRRCIFDFQSSSKFCSGKVFSRPRKIFSANPRSLKKADNQVRHYSCSNK